MWQRKQTKLNSKSVERILYVKEFYLYLGNRERKQLTISIKAKKANSPLTANFLSRAIFFIM